MADTRDPARRTTVAVLGVGGIGTTVAGLLVAAGRHDVVACVRRPIDRLVVHGPDVILDVPIRSLTDPAESPATDWVLLCAKVHDVPSTKPWLNSLCRPGTRLAVLQNGVGHTDRLEPLAGGAAILPTIVYFNAERLPDGAVRFGPSRAHDLAVPRTPDGLAFAELLAGTRLRVHVADDFDGLAWRKLLLNAVANPITALTMRRLAVFDREDVRALSLALIEEGLAVARADGIRLEADEAARILATLLDYPPDASTSMYFDRARGRPLEVDALLGAIVTRGARHGVPTPLNTALLTLLRAMEGGA
jgi:2-dehydropantoate 2-reductase